MTDFVVDSSLLHFDDLFEFGPFLVAFDSWILETAKDFFLARFLLAFSSFRNIVVTAAFNWDWGITGSCVIKSVASSVAVSIDFFSLNSACSALIWRRRSRSFAVDQRSTVMTGNSSLRIVLIFGATRLSSSLAVESKSEVFEL